MGSEVYRVGHEVLNSGRITKHIPRIMMDYNLTTMLEASDTSARRRLALMAITLATIPCYCLGWIAIALAPGPGDLTPTITQTLEISATPTLSLTPAIVTGTVTNTATFTPTFTATLTTPL